MAIPKRLTFVETEIQLLSKALSLEFKGTFYEISSILKLNERLVT